MTNSKETVNRKYKFKYIASIHNMKVKAYHVDNHIFSLHSFCNSYIVAGQALSFSGVNTYYQNSVVKRKIGYIINLSWTMLFYAMLS